jgi:hypothetical protein
VLRLARPRDLQKQLVLLRLHPRPRRCMLAKNQKLPQLIPKLRQIPNQPIQRFLPFHKYIVTRYIYLQQTTRLRLPATFALFLEGPSGFASASAASCNIVCQPVQRASRAIADPSAARVAFLSSSHSPPATALDISNALNNTRTAVSVISYFANSSALAHATSVTSLAARASPVTTSHKKS